MAKVKKAARAQRAKQHKRAVDLKSPAQSATSAADTRDYKVGRGRPPVTGQFKKNDGRERPGRPAGSKNLSTVIQEAIHAPVTVTINGKPRKITKLQATAMQLATKAATGDIKAIGNLLDWVNEIEARSEASKPSQYPLSDVDLEIVRGVHGRLSQYSARED